MPRHHHRQSSAHADVGQKLIPVFKPDVFEQLDFLIRAQPGRQAHGLECALQQLPAEFARVFLVLMLQKIPDRGARFCRHYVVQPQGRRHGGARRKNFHVIAVSDLLMQRHRLIVDARTDAVIAHVRVNGVGKIERARSFGEFLDIPVRSEHIDLIRVKVDFEVLKKLRRVARLILGAEQIEQPVVSRCLRTAVFLAGLVLPVGGHATLRDSVHFCRPDLYLNALAERAEKQGVQRLVSVGFGDGDVILELARYRLVGVMNHTEYAVAVIDRANNDPDGENIAHLRHRHPPRAHLAVDAVNIFFPTLHRTFDSSFGQLGFKLDDGFLDDRPVVAAAFAEFLMNRVVPLGIEVKKTQVLKFLGPGTHPQPVGNRGKDIEGLCGDPLALFGFQRIKRAHIVQPVGKFDQNDPDILGHCQQHLAEILRLCVLT